jgi:type I restriction enzyme S subunit
MSWEAEVRELGEVCSFQRGLTYAKGDEVDLSENVVLRANNISMATNALDFGELKYIKDSIAIPESKLVRRDTLMICTASGSKSHLGKVAYVDDDYGYAFGGFMGLLVPEREVRGRYLYYAMLSEDYKEFINGLSDGVNINNLKWDDLKSFTLPVPPLPEQQRIVGKLDAAFAALAEAQAHVERNRANARELFQATLQQAVIGETTARWRESNLDSKTSAALELKDLLKRIAATHRKRVPSEDLSDLKMVPLAIPIEWQYTTIEQIFNLIDYRGKTASKSQTGHRLITARNIRMGYLSEEPVTYISEEQYKKWMVRGYPKPGDIFFVTEGHTMGYVALNTRTDEFALAQRTITLQPATSLNTEFFFYYMLSAQFQKLVKLNGTGAAAVGMKATTFRRLPLAFPSAEEQKVIVDLLNPLRTETKRLEEVYQQKLAELAGLKKAVLGAAFRGEL